MLDRTGAEFVLPSTSYSVDHARIRSSRFPNGIVDASRGVICIPGYAAAGESFARLRPLAGAFDLHLLTLPDEGWRHADAIASFATMIEELSRRFDHPVLLGTSFGGAVAIRAAADLGTRIAGVVLISTFASLRKRGLLRILPFLEMIAPRFQRLTARFVGGRDLDDAAAAELLREVAAIPAEERHARLVAALKCDLEEAASSIRVPALVVHGTSDRVVPLSAGRRLADLIPNAEMQEIERAGHLPYVTRAAEVRALLSPFLRECFHTHSKMHMRAS